MNVQLPVGVKRVALVAFNGATELSVGGARDIFSAANMVVRNRLAPSSNISRSKLSDVYVVTQDGQAVKSFSGATIQADCSIECSHQFQLILITGFWGDVRQIIAENQQLLVWLRAQYQQDAIIGCLHAGSYLLAEAGLLDDKVATVYWRFVDDFKKRYRKVILMPEKTITAAGNIYTSSGVNSAIELASFLVEKLWGTEVAQKVARNFLMDVPRINSTFELKLSQYREHNDSLVHNAQNWLETHFSSDFMMEEVADKAGLSVRNLTRRFKLRAGLSPSQYLQKVRIEIACDLLRTTELSVDQITFRVGYSDVSSFCKLFKKITGKRPGEFRAPSSATTK
ncbi:GlxA family transcriptional regulator [Planctobacterium marinum]|uniref:AraC family transcriptional regulator n=1 Tax=Planctobacterium marinum TaxID=1631968 RepID=A0AA48HED2_9ALTE|nr:AraC family transcriptional regulator [Planctobacterium marinum]